MSDLKTYFYIYSRRQGRRQGRGQRRGVSQCTGSPSAGGGMNGTGDERHWRWAMDDGPWMMGDGRWAMDDGRWAMDDGRWAMDDGRLEVAAADGRVDNALRWGPRRVVAGTGLWNASGPSTHPLALRVTGGSIYRYSISGLRPAVWPQRATGGTPSSATLISKSIANRQHGCVHLIDIVSADAVAKAAADKGKWPHRRRIEREWKWGFPPASPVCVRTVASLEAICRSRAPASISDR